MAKPLREFVIPFTGLKLGKHVYDFEVNDTFFQEFEYSEIEKGDVTVVLTLEKKETLLILYVTFSGTVEVMCDRCTAPFDYQVEGENRQYVKFQAEPTDESEEITVLEERAYEIDVSHLLYEFICIALPSRRVHPEGKCDATMSAQLEEYLEYEPEDEEDEDPIDPRWAALKGLNKKD